MSSKKYFVIIAFLLFFFIGSQHSPAEIIKVSKLSKEKSEFSVSRDIFSPAAFKPTYAAERFNGRTPPPPPPPKVEEVKKEAREAMEDELRRSVQFEGYIIKETKSHALVNINGEYYVAAVGDMLMNNQIQVVKVEKKIIVLKAEAKEFEIRLKGDEDDEE